MTDPRLTTVHTKVSALSALYFPQLQDAICMTNSPGWLTMVIAMFRKVLPKKNLEKIVVYSGVASVWKSEWGKKMLRKEGLPASCGGTLPDSEVPPHYFGKLGGCEDDSPCQTELTVGSGKTDTIEIDVSSPTPCTEVHLYLIMDGHGINVGATFKGADRSSSSTLLEPTKCKYEEGLLKRVWPVTEAGKVVVTLDNTHSKWRSKSLKYGLWSAEKTATAAAAAAATDGDASNRPRPLGSVDNLVQNRGGGSGAGSGTSTSSRHTSAGVTPMYAEPQAAKSALSFRDESDAETSPTSPSASQSAAPPAPADSLDAVPLPYHRFKTASSWSGGSNAGARAVDAVPPNELREIVVQKRGTML